MGMGYEIGSLSFSAGEGSHEDVARIRVNATEDWTDTSSPTRMAFYITPVGAVHGQQALLIDENSNVEIYGNLLVEGVDGFNSPGEAARIDIGDFDNYIEVLYGDTMDIAGGVAISTVAGRFMITFLVSLIPQRAVTAFEISAENSSSVPVKLSGEYSKKISPLWLFSYFLTKSTPSRAREIISSLDFPNTIFL